MHDPSNHQGPRLWLLSGTGDGLRLALELQQLGWRLLVSVVTPEAALAYPALPGLELRVGPIDGQAGVREMLTQACRAGDPFLAVVDASHPFAVQITAALAAVWSEGESRQPPLLRLHRGGFGAGAEPEVRHLAHLDALADLPLAGRHLLLAIGARQLARAVALSPGALHHARLLPSATALQKAGAAGLAAARLACLRPGDPLERAVLRALLRRWTIDAVICRQSGGVTEQLWRDLAQELKLELLLLDRPEEPAAMRQLEAAELVAALEGLRPHPARQPGRGRPRAAAASPEAGGPAG
jgi:precorrin-6A/cobalt-precorrin-6A reductase